MTQLGDTRSSSPQNDTISDSTDSLSQPSEIKPDSRIGACEIVRNEAKELFLAANYPEAKKKYERLLQFVGMMFKARDGEMHLGVPFRLIAHLNLALCELKMRDYGECVKQCQEALKLDPNSLKAHLRMGKAYQEMSQLQSAETAFKRALELDPGLVEAKRALRELRKEDQESLRQQRKVLKNWTEKTRLYDDKEIEKTREILEKAPLATGESPAADNRLGIDIWRTLLWENWMFWVLVASVVIALAAALIGKKLNSV